MRFDLDAIDAPQSDSGAPRSIALQDIDEDPEQPRSEFGDESLRELAATIAERGVKQPVSVRPHPKEPGRWMLNFGARRLRAAKLAGLASIPVFVDEAADSYDQVIENEQREALTPLELALFVQRRDAGGDRAAHRQEQDVHHLHDCAHRCTGLAAGSVPKRPLPWPARTA
jgi:ParB family transcriptional regulator, chromosome partitioning protein